jgi:hypothetical protein
MLALRDEGVGTAQQITARTGIAHSMVRDALARLVQGGAVRALPKAGGTRSPQYYEPADGDVWPALVAAAEALFQEAQNQATSTLRT